MLSSLVQLPVRDVTLSQDTLRQPEPATTAAVPRIAPVPPWINRLREKRDQVNPRVIPFTPMPDPPYLRMKPGQGLRKITTSHNISPSVIPTRNTLLRVASKTPSLRRTIEHVRYARHPTTNSES